MLILINVYHLDALLLCYVDSVVVAQTASPARRSRASIQSKLPSFAPEVVPII